MSISASLRKGFRFFLMSMGVSTYSRKSLNQPQIEPHNQPRNQLNSKPAPPSVQPPSAKQ